MSDVLGKIWEGLEMSFLMAYEVWWALVLGFAISAIVQAWVPRARIEGALSGEGFAPIAKATALGAASSSCSYAAIAIAKSLFQKGASAVTALSFQSICTSPRKLTPTPAQALPEVSRCRQERASPSSSSL